MFSSEQWLANSGADFYNGQATQSVRFEGDNSAGFLSRTGMSASNRRTWTWSCWVKRINLDANTQGIFGMIDLSSVNRQCYIAFDSNHKIYIMNYSQYAGDAVYNYVTTQVFRDLSAWYHIVWVSDTTNGTAGDRIRLYVNGVRITSFTIATNPSQNYEGWINGDGGSGVQLGVGRVVPYAPSAEYLASYMSDANFVDGLALAPTNFGEFKSGAWIPIEPDVSDYGTNGFRLKFDQVGVGTASTSTIGADSSGKTNHYTSSGIVASDCAMPDSPENNFATLNPLDADGHTNSEGNLKVSGNVIYGHEKSTFAVTSGKWYFEGKLAVQQNDTAIGLANQNASTLSHYLGNNTDSVGYLSDGRFFYNGSSQASYSSYGTSDVGQIAFDADTGEIWIGKNNTWQNSGDPANGTGEVVTVSWSEFIVSARTVGSGAMVFNFGQDDTFVGAITSAGNTDGNGKGVFKHAPPSGFLALCTANLPEPTIGPNSDTQADDHFNTVLWTGDNNARSIDDVGFQPDWLWTKSRSNAESHRLHDSSRGDNGTVMYELNSDATEVEGTDTLVTGFDAEGFNIAAGGNTPNVSGRTYVAWNWKANGGTTSSNTDGTITSTVQANTTAGFSIVTYTGTGSNATVGHGLGGLGQALDMLIVKNRDTAKDWRVWFKGFSGTERLELNNTDAKASTATSWNETIPTSTVFSLGADTNTNNNTDDYLAYCFHSVEGYSKFGVYTGNGNADGTFVYLGFRPAWIMVKRTDSADNWAIYDSVRDTFNVRDSYLYADLANVEATYSTAIVDFLSNGFKWRGAVNFGNNSSGTYIYMAFADSEGAFKYANAR